MASLFEKLPQNEVNMMEKYIDDYAFHEDGASRHVNMETILREWNKNKVNLYDMLGEKFIISKEITFEKSLEDRVSELNDGICHRYYNNGEGEKMSAARRFYDAVWNEIAYAKVFPSYSHDKGCFMNMLNPETLAENLYNGDQFIIPNPKDEAHPIKVPDGCRPIRVLGKVAEAYDLPGYEEFRQLHSLVLNQKMLTGILTLSIHPLDYMTMSDNECDWSSCMSWKEEGCYRQGTVEMMNSSTVVVAYLASEENMYMGRGEYWNNKKWRQLFIVNDTMIGNVKGYPYQHDGLTAACLDWLKELAEVNLGRVKYNDEITKYGTGEEINFGTFYTYVSPRTNNMYNDFNRHQFAYFNLEALSGYNGRTYRPNYSGPSMCLSCGEVNPGFSSEEYLACENCECYTHCEECGDAINCEDDVYWVDDVCLCESCYMDLTAEDWLSLDYHLKDNMIQIYYAEDGRIDTHRSIWVYMYGYRAEERMKKYFKRVHAVHTNHDNYFYVSEDDINTDIENIVNIFGETWRSNFIEIVEDENRETKVIHGVRKFDNESLYYWTEDNRREWRNIDYIFEETNEEQN